MTHLPAIYHDLSQPERRLVREEYRKLQSDKCHFCKGDLKESPNARITQRKINWRLFPPNFLRHPVHLHHSHDTGLTIGAVHAYCNAVLWQYHGE